MEQRSIQVQIHGISGMGQGIGRLPDGITVFIPSALPGETVTAKITQKKKRFAFAELLSVDQPAAERIGPACPFADKCGGCAFQHASYDAELEWKRDAVEQTLRRIGGQDITVEPIDRPEQEFHYRNRVVWHVSHSMQLGFFEEKSHRLIEGNCLLLEEPLLKYTEALRKILPQHKKDLQGLKHIALRCDHNGEVLITFVTEQPIRIWEALISKLEAEGLTPAAVWENSGEAVYSVYGADWKQIAGDEFTDIVAGNRLEIAPAAFLQVNRREAERLYALAKEFAGLTGNEKVFDLYAGGGSIGLSLAKDAAEVIAVENYGPAAEAAERNARRNNCSNFRIYNRDTEVILPELVRQGVRADVAVLDPPRAGCDGAALEAILEAAPKRIVYISCDPATLARDLKILTAEHYELKRVKPVDLFSRTAHVETAALLIRR